MFLFIVDYELSLVFKLFLFLNGFIPFGFPKNNIISSQERFTPRKPLKDGIESVVDKLMFHLDSVYSVAGAME